MPLPAVPVPVPPGEKAKANRVGPQADPPCDHVTSRARIGQPMVAVRTGKTVHSGMTDLARPPSCTQKITPLDGVAVLGFPARPPVKRSTVEDEGGTTGVLGDPRVLGFLAHWPTVR
jgi:hypothetical protein